MPSSRPPARTRATCSAVMAPPSRKDRMLASQCWCPPPWPYSRPLACSFAPERCGTASEAIGSEEAGGVSDVYVDGLTGADPRLSTGVLIKAQSLYGAGTVEQVYMRNFRLAGVRNAVITMTYLYGGVPESAGPFRPTFRDVSFSGFTTS